MRKKERRADTGEIEKKKKFSFCAIRKFLIRLMIIHM